MQAKAVYLHIPFCKTICTYCDFPKVCYEKKWIRPYLEALKEEIKSTYQKEEIESLYIGGGTPTSLAKEELELLLSFSNLFQKSNSCEFTIEANPEDLIEEKIQLLQKYHVNRVSIGVQTTHPKHLKTLGRTLSMEKLKEGIQLLKESGIENINMDLMYALPKETIKEVKEDVEKLIQLGVPHISTYSLILEEHTKLYLENTKPINEEIDASMYQEICQLCREHGYQHYEISNFAKPGFASKHNMTYWKNQPYYGFGLGASGYLQKKRYTNTKNLFSYLQNQNQKEIEEITQKEQMEYHMILGLRMLKGVSKKEFEKRYQKKIEQVFEVESLCKQGLLQTKGDYLSIPEDKIYLSNEILLSFLLEENTNTSHF